MAHLDGAALIRNPFQATLFADRAQWALSKHAIAQPRREASAVIRRREILANLGAASVADSPQNLGELRRA